MVKSEILFESILNINWHVITCRNHHHWRFSFEKEVIAEELGGQPCDVSWILTFSFSKASHGAYSTYRMQYCVLLY
jgi:hypothetical protein